MKRYQKNLLGLLLLVVVISIGLMFKTEQVPVAYQAESMIEPARQSPIEKSILESFRRGVASTLSLHLSDEVNLTILDKEDIYSTSETLEGLQTFFRNHPPVSMIKKHSGVSKNGDGQYFIGVLTTESGEKYRCYFFMELLKITSIEIKVETGMG